MDSPSASKMTWSTMKSRTPSLDSENSSKLSTPDIGNTKENSPTKPEFPDLLETSPNTSPTLTSPNQVWKRFFQSQTEEPQLQLYPGQGLNFRTEEVHHSQPFLETRERWKANPAGASAPS